MSKLLDWEITPYRDTLEIFEGKEDRLLAVSRDSQVIARISSQTTGPSPLIRLTSGDVTFILDPTAKTISIQKR
jgi:hypothetical protein